MGACCCGTNACSVFNVRAHQRFAGSQGVPPFARGTFRLNLNDPTMSTPENIAFMKAYNVLLLLDGGDPGGLDSQAYGKFHGSTRYYSKSDTYSFSRSGSEPGDSLSVSYRVEYAQDRDTMATRHVKIGYANSAEDRPDADTYVWDISDGGVVTESGDRNYPIPQYVTAFAGISAFGPGFDAGRSSTVLVATADSMELTSSGYFAFTNPDSSFTQSTHRKVTWGAPYAASQAYADALATLALADLSSLRWTDATGFHEMQPNSKLTITWNFGPVAGIAKARVFQYQYVTPIEFPQYAVRDFSIFKQFGGGHVEPSGLTSDDTFIVSRARFVDGGQGFPFDDSCLHCFEQMAPIENSLELPIADNGSQCYYTGVTQSIEYFRTGDFIVGPENIPFGWGRAELYWSCNPCGSQVLSLDDLASFRLVGCPRECGCISGPVVDGEPGQSALVQRTVSALEEINVILYATGCEPLKFEWFLEIGSGFIKLEDAPVFPGFHGTNTNHLRIDGSGSGTTYRFYAAVTDVYGRETDVCFWYHVF